MWAIFAFGAHGLTVIKYSFYCCLMILQQFIIKDDTGLHIEFSFYEAGGNDNVHKYILSAYRSSSVMSCLHCRFQVIKHHISSGSNPDLGPEVQSRLLDFVLLFVLFFFFLVEFILFIVISIQWLEFFFLPRLFNNKSELHPLLRSLLMAAVFRYGRPFFFLP